MKNILSIDDFINEKWEDAGKINHTGENSGKTIEQLKAEREIIRAKKKEDTTSADSKRLRQITFAIRAKQRGSGKWGKVKENEDI